MHNGTTKRQVVSENATSRFYGSDFSGSMSCEVLGVLFSQWSHRHLGALQWGDLGLSIPKIISVYVLFWVNMSPNSQSQVRF